MTYRTLHRHIDFKSPNSAPHQGDYDQFLGATTTVPSSVRIPPRIKGIMTINDLVFQGIKTGSEFRPASRGL